ncbi:plasmid mobilization relaxosome protein MobC [Clostridium perfringens]|uniref:plasmid mobilization relaxosome protein MobC n=1 Tax=Clostridium perfringens TaxID=1502 RepID=UPI003A8E45A2
MKNIENSKLDKSKYLRALALNGEIKNIDFTYLDNLIMEINRIGTNINQIARRVNESNNIYKSELKELKIYLEEINEKIYGMLGKEN